MYDKLRAEQVSDAQALARGDNVKCAICLRWVKPEDDHGLTVEGGVICPVCLADGLPQAWDNAPKEVHDYPEPAPGLCLGYLRLDRAGDLAPAEVVCVSCGETCNAGVWLAALATRRGYSLQGPYCDLCADSA